MGPHPHALPSLLTNLGSLPLAELPPHARDDARSRSAQHRSAFLLSVAIRLCTPARRAAPSPSSRPSLAFGATSQRFPAFSCDSAMHSRSPSCHLTLETTLARVRRNIAALSCFQLRFGTALPRGRATTSRSAQFRCALPWLRSRRGP